MRFAICPVHLSELLRLPRKSDARSYEVLHLSRKIISANLKIRGSKMQPVSGNQHPDLLTALMNMSLVLRLPRKMHLCRSCSSVPRLPSFLKCYTTLTFCSLLTRCTIPCACHAKRHLNVQKWREHVVLCTFWLRNVLRATTACTFSTSQLPKVVRTWCVLYFLTSKCASRHNSVHFFDISIPKVVRTWGVFSFFTCKCASRHNGVHFFDISTSKSGPNVRFLLAFSLANVLRATTACNFSTSQFPKVVRTWGVFSFFTCTCASCHNGVHFFDISTSKSGPNVRFFTCKCASRHNSVHFFDISISKSGPNVRFFLAFSLANVLRATTACTFSTSQFPKVVRMWGVFSFFTCTCALCHNGVQFFISHLARWLCTRRFSKPTFRFPEPQIIGKTQCLATFLPFRAPWSSFFWFFLFSDVLSSTLLSSTLLFSLTLPISAFHLSILSEVWLLNSFDYDYDILRLF